MYHGNFWYFIMTQNTCYLTKLSHWPYWYPCLCWAHSLSAQPGPLAPELRLDIPGQAGDTHTLHTLPIFTDPERKQCCLCLPCPIELVSPLDPPSTSAWPGAGWPGLRAGGLVAPGLGLGGGLQTEGGQDHEVLKYKFRMSIIYIEASLLWAPS